MVLRYRRPDAVCFLRLPPILLFLGLLLISCGGGSGASGSNAGGDRFLMASQAGLTESTPNGTVATLLKFDDASYILDPALSPDGKLIAFARQMPAKPLPDGRVDFGTDLYIVGRDGKDPREVLHHAAIAEFLRSPAWVSNTELLVAVQGVTAEGTSDFRMENVDIATGVRKRVLEKIIGASVAADRSAVVLTTADPLTQEQSLAMANADATSVKPLVTAESGLGFFASPVFSPDGKKIAFAAVDLKAPVLAPTATPRSDRSNAKPATAALHPFAQDVWIVNSDGTGLKRLAEIAENQPSVAWTGDGTSVYAVGANAFWKIDVASGKAARVGSGVPLGQIIWTGKG